MPTQMFYDGITFYKQGEDFAFGIIKLEIESVWKIKTLVIIG